MTCSERELALYAGGDLQDSELEQHIHHCEHCREYVDSMRALLSEMASDRAPTVPPIAAAVMRRIRRGRYGWAALTATAAAAAVIAVSAGSVLMRPLPAPVFTRHAPAAPDLRHAAGPVRATPHLVRHRRTVPAKPAEPVVVKLITDDPNVIIYWITD